MIRVAVLVSLLAIGCSKDNASKPAVERTPPPAEPTAVPPVQPPQLPAAPRSPTQAELALMKNPPHACATTADCAMVTKECCDCSAGGQQIAIRADQADAYRAATASMCGATMCAQVISKHPSCLATATCVRGTCTYGEPGD